MPILAAMDVASFTLFAGAVFVGSYVQAGDAVVHLVSDGELEVEADVPFERLGGMQPGAAVDLTLDDGTRHVARVRTVIPTVARSRMPVSPASDSEPSAES